MKQRLIIAGLAIVGLFIWVGCGSSDEPDPAILAVPATQVCPEGADCGTDGDFPEIPVPEIAREVTTLQGDSGASNVRAGRGTLFEVPTWTYDDLNAWYDAQIPPDSPFQGFESCDTIDGDALKLMFERGRQRQPLSGDYTGYEFEDNDTVGGVMNDPVQTRTWASFEQISGRPQYIFEGLSVDTFGITLGNGGLPQVYIEATNYAVATKEFAEPDYDSDNPRDDIEVTGAERRIISTLSPECESQGSKYLAE